MSKKYIYTVLSLGAAAIFLFSGMVCMPMVLHTRERELLSESGKAIVESPVRAWQEKEDGTEIETGSDFDGKRYTLTTEQLEAAVNSWNNRAGETLHNPVGGQIPMEEAIEAGKKWLIDMGIELTGEEYSNYTVNATLSVGNQKELTGLQLEPYYSFWTVQLKGQSKNTVLYLNAVTGKVCGAEITLYENLPEVLPYENLEQFAEMAGLQGTDTVIDQESMQAILPIEDSCLIAGLKIKRIPKKFYDVNTDSELFNEYAVIVYELTVSKK